MAAKPSFELRLRVLNAVFDAPGITLVERIQFVAAKTFTDLFVRPCVSIHLAYHQYLSVSP